MNYCMNCGREYDGAPGYCPECAATYQQPPYQQAPQYQQPPYQQAPYQQPPVQNVYVQAPYPPTEVDAPNTGFAILSFFFPIVGLILYIIWKDKTPLKAKSCGKGALISVIVSVVGSIVSTILYVVLLGGLFALEAGMYY
ncbi:MAG: hypothetical protein J6L62_03415 [Clostridia bacterium]|nr:hypothetical protein [Clostridia bacterium]